MCQALRFPILFFPALVWYSDWIVEWIWMGQEWCRLGQLHRLCCSDFCYKFGVEIITYDHEILFSKKKTPEKTRKCISCHVKMDFKWKSPFSLTIYAILCLWSIYLFCLEFISDKNKTRNMRIYAMEFWNYGWIKKTFITKLINCIFLDFCNTKHSYLYATF